ncbi:hypothetical protein [Arthrobacter sp. Br18]|uniref:hypothetical protein n=1 Tax=Arthrobacter sp. Br18 TaxID=1312954 RepID=UPI0020A63D32|nr:hypothetical protein [Arthrobacter sp. Br18]
MSKADGAAQSRRAEPADGRGSALRGQARNRPVLVALRVLIAAGLIVSAVIHFQLAPGFQQAYPAGIGGGTLFRIQAVVAVLAALYVLVRGSRAAYAAAAVVALSALAAVVLYRYIQIPAIGPIPSMYEPVWYASKTLTAAAEATAGILAAIGYTRLSRRQERI